MVVSSGSLLAVYRAVRALSEALCRPLAIEDYVVQSMPDASPTKWHLAHTTWFWETFLLVPNLPEYRPFHQRYGYLFNSYYETVGARHPRSERGLLSRPTVAETFAFRAHVDEAMSRLLELGIEDEPTRALIELGLSHEQQHQELLVTDLKHMLGSNPLRPPYREIGIAPEARALPLRWQEYAGGLVSIGHRGGGFAFDNETPRHQAYTLPYRLATRLVTNHEYLQFMQDEGYACSSHWLSEGWAVLNEQRWRAPLYWERLDGEWWTYTLGGMRRVAEDEPVCHVSFFEADAFARWAGKRLPSEIEWEHAASAAETDGNFLDSRRLHPAAAVEATSSLAQLFGDTWEWTASQYTAYPGYRPAEGAVGEYNGKFMCNQFVLRGGSCATPPGHIRATYRNFFPPSARWQFSGIRLADDA